MIQPIETKYDVAVIGSGPGGAVTAFYLAKAGLQVVLIEEGDSNLNTSAFSIDEVRTKYRNAGLTAALGRPIIPYIEGRCLGGGSEVNSGLYQRSSEEVLREWESRYQITNFTTELLESYNYLDHEFFGTEDSGPSMAARKLADGANLQKWKWVNVPQLTLQSQNGQLIRKKSMRETYIPAAQKAGCVVLCGLRVDKLVQKSDKSWRMQCYKANRKLVSIEAQSVFVCAGAIHTPAVLQRSGLKHNIGRTLAMHPSAKIVAEFADDVNLTNMGPGAIQVKEFAPDLTFGCSVSSSPFLAATLTMHPESLKHIESDFKKMAVFYTSIRGASVGRIHVIPGMKDPIVNYSLPKEQYVQLYEGVQKLSHLLKSLKVNKVYLPFRDPRRISLANYHLFGSVPCGEDRRITAANSYGAIHGYKNLYVSDASLFGSAPGVNPQATIMAMARRNALHFISEKRP